MEAKCKNCKFWEKGTCHRYPKTEEKGPDDWCGEFKIGGDGDLEVRHDLDGEEHLR